jgi:hypothetical protein
MDIQFSYHCGENIELSEEKHRASWTHRFSGGIAFSSQQLQNKNNLKLDLAGTGHAYVGVVTFGSSFAASMSFACYPRLHGTSKVKTSNQRAVPMVMQVFTSMC